MSNYGPPGGGYPGQPQDPWQGGNPYGGQPGGDPYGQPGGDPYGGQPSDPYGQPPPSGPYGQPPPSDPYGQPSGPPDPYGQPSGPPAADPWGAPPPGGQMPPPGGPYGQPSGPPMSGAPWGPPAPPQKSGTNTGLIVGLAVVVVLILICGGGIFLYAMTSDSNPKADPSASASPSESPSESPSPSPSESPTKYNINDAEEGDCLYDSDPSDTTAQLSFVSCEERGSDHYKILKRIDDTQDAKKCEDVPDYEVSFTVSSGNFVLCVEELK